MDEEPRQAVKRPIEAVGGAKKPRVGRFAGAGQQIDDFGPSGFGLGWGAQRNVPDRPGFAAFSSASARLPEDVPTSRSAPSQDVREAARQKMMDVYKRKTQETAKGKAFAQRVAEESKRRRGGAPGDVVPLGKRKEREPEMPRSILRKPGGTEGPASSKQRIYGPRTQVFNIA